MRLWLLFPLKVGSAVLYLRWLAKIFMAKKTTTFPKQTLTTKHLHKKAIVYIWLSQNINHAQDSKFGHVSLELLEYEYDRVARKHRFVPGSYRQNTYMSLGPADYPPRPEQILEQLRPYFVDNYRDDLIYEERPPDLTFYFHSLDVGSMMSRIGLIKEQNAVYGLLGPITFGKQTDTAWKRLASWIKRLAILSAIFVNKWLLFIPFIPIVNAFRFRLLPSSATTANSYSCVSSVFDIFRTGQGVSKLLGFSDELFTSLFSSMDASKQSSESSKEQELKKCLSKMFASFGYLTEATISSVIISPDIFADFMKQAKLTEIKLYNIPSEKTRFKEENIEIKNVEHTFETEEWLPSSDTEPNGFGYNFILYGYPIIFVASLGFLLPKVFSTSGR